jgi:hypothetical protein
MEKETFEKACRIYDRIKEIERNESNISEVLKVMERKCTNDLLNEISYKLRGGDFSSRINERIRNTIKEELEKELVNLEAEKAVKEREMEML